MEYVLVVRKKKGFMCWLYLHYGL